MIAKLAITEALQLIKYYTWEITQGAEANDWDGVIAATLRVTQLASELHELLVEEHELAKKF